MYVMYNLLSFQHRFQMVHNACTKRFFWGERGVVRAYHLSSILRDQGWLLFWRCSLACLLAGTLAFRRLVGLI